MKKVFTVTNNFELAPYKDALSRERIDFLVKNELGIGLVGEIPVNESWPQIWVTHDQDEHKAREICLQLESSILSNQDDWQCTDCGETNGANFEYCWHCGVLEPA
jgi:hypothetical protein